jgi:hypothetical protein
VSPVFAPSQAGTAYTCFWTDADPSSAPEIWATHDGGGSWRLVGHVPATPAGPCSLTVDATQPTALVATVTKYIGGRHPPSSPNGQNFVSVDGGHTWTRMESKRDYAELATYHGLTYALVDVYSQSTPSISYHLAVSTDLRSWRIIDQPIIQAGTQGNINEVGRFWLNPSTGALLAVSTNTTAAYESLQSFSSVGLPQRLWTSTDGGQTWTEITYPGFGAETVAVQPPPSGQSWHLCVTNWVVWVPLDAMNGNNLLACTSDGGATWKPRPALNIPWSDVEPAPPSDNSAKSPLVTMHGVAPLGILTIGVDGSLIAAVNDTNTPSMNERWDVFRLPPNGSVWERIGRVPDADGTFEVYPSGVIFYSAGQDYTTTYS